MQQRRRHILAGLGGLGITALAGCRTFSDDETDTASLSTQVSKLVAADGDDRDMFGAPVAIADDGSTAVIGGYSTGDSNSEGEGSASVFSAADGS